MRHGDVSIDVFGSGKLNFKSSGSLSDMGRALADLIPFFAKHKCADRRNQK